MWKIKICKRLQHGTFKYSRTKPGIVTISNMEAGLDNFIIFCISTVFSSISAHCWRIHYVALHSESSWLLFSAAFLSHSGLSHERVRYEEGWGERPIKERPKQIDGEWKNGRRERSRGDERKEVIAPAEVACGDSSNTSGGEETRKAWSIIKPVNYTWTISSPMGWNPWVMFQVKKKKINLDTQVIFEP